MNPHPGPGLDDRQIEDRWSRMEFIFVKLAESGEWVFTVVLSRVSDISGMWRCINVSLPAR